MKIKVILGTTRPERFSEKVAPWVIEELKKREDVEVELLDLRNYPIPFYEEISSPKMLKGEVTNEIAKKWKEKIADGDAFIFITAEYNHGYPAVLKNAIDYVYFEWNKKPAAFVGYGTVGGARSIEQLRQVVIELQMAPIKSSIHIPGPVYKAVLDKAENPFEPLNEHLNGLFDDLLWWAVALKEARER